MSWDREGEKMKDNDPVKAVLCYLPEYTPNTAQGALDHYRKVLAERDRLRKALEWYAARRTGERCWHTSGESIIDEGGGRLARRALRRKDND